MRELETFKLFYDQYLYRLVIQHPLGSIFRDKKFDNARNILDEMQTQADNGRPLEWQRGYRYIVPISTKTLATGQYLLREFTKIDFKSFKLRCESPSIGIYSNNINWLLAFTRSKLDVTSLSRPHPDIVSDLVPNVIVVKDEIQHEYKITLGGRVSTSLADWIAANRDKCKAGPKFLETVRNGRYVDGYYFYVRDEKVLQLVQLIVGGKIKRIDKFINSMQS